MKLNFSYSKEKDIVNFLNSKKAVNRKTPTKTEELFENKYSGTEDENSLGSSIDSYLKDENIDIEKKISEAKKAWEPIEDGFIAKAEEIFLYSYPIEEITAYLATNNRCTYNINEKYFFISLRTKTPNATIMHELLHFYTWEVFGRSAIEKELINRSDYNNIKESLTVILNIEFSNLMDGVHDNG